MKKVGSTKVHVYICHAHSHIPLLEIARGSPSGKEIDHKKKRKTIPKSIVVFLGVLHAIQNHLVDPVWKHSGSSKAQGRAVGKSQSGRFDQLLYYLQVWN
jgi:hypothetical protein